MGKRGWDYKWEVLALLWVAFFINQADRQVFNVVLPLIRHDLKLTDVQTGLIATVFNLFFALLVPFSGYVADIYSRKWIIVFSIMFWSVATMLTGFSQGILSLILFRSIATGGGEAFFGPANYTLLASYHQKTRSLAMSIHQTSLYVGIIVCGYLAGYVGEQWGWKKAFYLFGSVGILYAILLMVRLKDAPPKPTGVPVETQEEKVKFWDAICILFKTPTALMLTVSFAGLIFVLTGYLTWTPTYLYEKFNMSLSLAGFHSMFYTHACALVGILWAGKLSDQWSRKDPSRRLTMQAMGLLAAVPFILLIGNANIQPVIYIGFAGFGFARAFFDANTYAVLYDVIPAKYQSSASGVMMMIGFVIGSSSPVLLGFLKSTIGLSGGFSMLAIVWLICGILLLIARKYYFKNDYVKNH